MRPSSDSESQVFDQQPRPFTLMGRLLNPGCSSPEKVKDRRSACPLEGSFKRGLMNGNNHERLELCFSSISKWAGRVGDERGKREGGAQNPRQLYSLLSVLV